mmetsp:Transcript_23506/g.55399  ORF Transcript_23506/g.55399 Transcript_23506/m.55399 type:complete len:254 (+) Transcript_23506:266-1027(+)
MSMFSALSPSVSRKDFSSSSASTSSAISITPFATSSVSLPASIFFFLNILFSCFSTSPSFFSFSSASSRSSSGRKSAFGGALRIASVSKNSASAAAAIADAVSTSSSSSTSANSSISCSASATANASDSSRQSSGLPRHSSTRSSIPQTALPTSSFINVSFVTVIASISSSISAGEGAAIVSLEILRTAGGASGGAGNLTTSPFAELSSRISAMVSSSYTTSRSASSSAVASRSILIRSASLRSSISSTSATV